MRQSSFLKSRVFLLLLAAAVLPGEARADLLERRAGRLIRDSGRWCDTVKDVRAIKHRSNDQMLFFLVTCGGRKFAQYEILIGPDGELIDIKDY